MFHWYFCKPPPNFECEEHIKKHKKDKSLIEYCSLDHLRAQECSWVFSRTFDVPHYFCRPHLSNVLEEEIEKKLNMLLWPYWALLSSQLFLRAFDKWSSIPPPSFLMLKGTFNVPLIFLQTFSRFHFGS